MRLEVVTTTFNSKSTIEEFLFRVNDSISKSEMQIPVALTIVDDGSTDGTPEYIEKLELYRLNFLTIKLVELSRNFGHHKAILEGLNYFDGDSELLLIIDSDGEEDPADIHKMLSLMNKEKSDMVITYQSKRKTGIVNRILASLAEIILKLYLPNKQISRVCTLRLLKRTVVESMKAYKISDPVLAYIDNEIGFKKSFLLVEKKFKGHSQYTLKRRLHLFFHLLIFGTDFVKRMTMTLIAIGIFTTVCVSALLLWYRITSPQPLAGYTTTNLLIAGFSGILIALLAAIIYLASKIMNELGSRPRTIVRRVADLHG